MNDKQVILFIAVSVDGYIADINKKTNWLSGQNPNQNDMLTYQEFIENIDTIIMGYSTYNQVINELSVDNWTYSNQKTYVLTTKTNLKAPHKNIEFWNDSLEQLINKVKKETNKNIWICGGASIVNQLLKLDLIDKFHLNIIPTILGDGIKLFDKLKSKIDLKLIETKNYNGIVDLIYIKR